MKLRLLLTTLCVMVMPLLALAERPQTYEGTLYLTNGNTVTGTITDIEGDAEISITTPTGATYRYTRSEVRRISTSGRPKAIPAGRNVPEEGFWRESNSFDSGFWCAAESATGYSCRINHSNFGYEEISVVGGYRFNEFVRVGLGVGGRYYWENSKVRYDRTAWAGPLFVNVRGCFMRRAQRSVVPMYTFDIGGTFRDGFLIRPGVGIRVGELRNAFTLALCYTGQQTDKAVIDPDGNRISKSGFISFVSLKLGYEF